MARTNDLYDDRYAYDDEYLTPEQEAARQQQAQRARELYEERRRQGLPAVVARTPQEMRAAAAIPVDEQQRRAAQQLGYTFSDERTAPQTDPEPGPTPTPKTSSDSGGGSSWFDTFAAPTWTESYVPQVWSETFKPLTMAEMEADQGYQNRYAAMLRGQERAAAAKGSILSGGYIGRALPRALGEFASQEYDVANNRRRSEYDQRYSQFQDAEQARYNAYLQRYRQFQDSIANNMDLAQLGLSATTGGRP